MSGSRRQSDLLEAPTHGEEERRQKHPPLGVVAPRPAGVLWARAGTTEGSRLCEDAAHPVYVREHTRRRIGSPGETETVLVYACAVCWLRETR